MKLNLPIALWALAGTLFFASISHATDDLARLQERLESVKTMQGDFNQVLHDDDGTVLEESHGQFALERPGKFYWHTLAPFEQQLVSDQEFLWLYDPDLEQVIRRAYDQEQVRSTPAAILSDDLKGLGDNFAVRYQGQENGRTLFALSPRVQDDMFEELTLAFTDEGLVEIRVHDNLGQQTTFSLMNVQRNQPVKQQLFQFVPPKGVDVLVD